MAEQRRQRTTSDLPTLPDELICSDILPRVRALDLARFRTVCKPWLNTISNPEFHKCHLKHQSPGRIQRHPDGLLYRHPEDPGEVVLSLAHIGDPQQPISPKTSCNGLVVVCRGDVSVSYYITNPVTGRYMKFPRLPGRARYCFLHLDATSNQYTLYGWDIWDQKIYWLEFKAKLEWTRFNPQRRLLMDYCPPVVLRGSLCWMAARWLHGPTGPESKSTILAMHMKRKEFREIEVPVPVQVPVPITDNDLRRIHRLTVMEGSLYLIEKHKHDPSVGDEICNVIWRLEDEEGRRWSMIYRHFKEDCAGCKERSLESCDSACTPWEAKKIRDSCVWLYNSSSNMYDNVPHTNSLMWF